jgi:hypothetical protein
VGAFFTPGRRCPPDQRSLSDRRLPLHSGQPYTPLEHPIGGAADNGAYEDSLAFTRPAFPSPATPGWNGSSFGFPLGFAPRSHPRRTPGRGRSFGHWTGSHPHRSTSNRSDHSSRATSRRTTVPSFTGPLRRPDGEPPAIIAGDAIDACPALDCELPAGRTRVVFHAATRMHVPTKRAGIGKPVGPHTLRHAFITAALEAGVPLRDVQEAASHADPRTTMRYDRARASLDRRATYIVAAYVAGAAR